jgi:transposase
MARPVAVTRMDHSAGELRALAGRSRDGDQVRRLFALALVLEGQDRTRAAELNGMDRQTLRDWVHRYNQEGVEGLLSRPSTGRPRSLSPERRAELKTLVIEGPDPQTHGVVRWRCVDLQKEIEQRYGVKAHVHSIAKWLHQLDLTRLQPRPRHPQQEDDAQDLFKKASPRS